MELKNKSQKKTFPDNLMKILPGYLKIICANWNPPPILHVNLNVTKNQAVTFVPLPSPNGNLSQN